MMEPTLRPIRSAKKPITSCPKMIPDTARQVESVWAWWAGRPAWRGSARMSAARAERERGRCECVRTLGVGQRVAEVLGAGLVGLPALGVERLEQGLQVANL